MANRIHTRVRLGEYFSEGARQLWLSMSCQQLNQIDVAKMLAKMRGRALHRGVVNRLLYGERRPGLELALDLQEVFGIVATSWVEEPRGEFTAPAAARLLAEMNATVGPADEDEEVA